MMDFGALPPEINSARMYAGPGAGSLLLAAASWDGLAAELNAVAASYESAIAGLTVGSWLGPTAALMAAAAAPFVSWMKVTAAQAEQAGMQAAAAVAAYEAARSMTVPPPVIAENRAVLTMLIATDVFGQNAPAIAATEAAYAEMWGQDAAAMYGYAATSAAASTLTPFEAAPETTNVGGLARQAAAVEEAAGAAARQLMAELSAALQLLAQPLRNPAHWEWLLELWKGIAPHLAPIREVVSIGQNFVSVANNAFSMTQLAALRASGATAAAAEGAAKAMASGVSALGPAAGGGVAAGLGRAASVGSLSVPQGWAAANQAIGPAARALPLSGLDSAAQSGPEHMLGGLPLGPTGAGAGGGGVNNALRMPPRAYVMPRIPAAG